MEFVKPGKYVELTYDLYEVENGKEELMLLQCADMWLSGGYGSDGLRMKRG